ncbi:MAG: hypothetical protein ACI8VW_003142, partial [bacterium]
QCPSNKLPIAIPSTRLHIDISQQIVHNFSRHWVELGIA